MTNKLEVAIIGGGFSALVLANALKTEKIHGRVVIFERLNRVGKKILATGNGRGNISNKQVSVENYHGECPRFVSYAIGRHTSLGLRSFFSNLGLMFATEDDRIYPASMQANSILDVLRFNLANKNVEVATDSQVTKIKRVNDGYQLFVGNEIYFANKVVFAFGGSSQKQFGTDGSAFALAKSLGHRVTELSPSLVQMRAKGENLKGLKGIKAYARLALTDNNKEIKCALGDILFTDSGISGNAVFYLSSYLSGTKSPKVIVEFIPEITKNRLIDHLLYKKSMYGRLESGELLNGIVHKQIGKNIVKACTSAQVLGDITTEEIKKISRLIKSFPIDIMGTLGFDYSQVTHGGIDTNEVFDTTFESKICKNLYIIGEALDIDGDCGGYNLQWAYSSAMCCGEALNGKNK